MRAKKSVSLCQSLQRHKSLSRLSRYANPCNGTQRFLALGGHGAVLRKPYDKMKCQNLFISTDPRSLCGVTLVRSTFNSHAVFATHEWWEACCPQRCGQL